MTLPCTGKCQDHAMHDGMSRHAVKRNCHGECIVPRRYFRAPHFTFRANHISSHMCADGHPGQAPGHSKMGSPCSMGRTVARMLMPASITFTSGDELMYPKKVSVHALRVAWRPGAGRPCHEHRYCSSWKCAWTPAAVGTSGRTYRSHANLSKTTARCSRRYLFRLRAPPRLYGLGLERTDGGGREGGGRVSASGTPLERMEVCFWCTGCVLCCGGGRCVMCLV